jgi:hypothetical protein
MLAVLTDHQSTVLAALALQLVQIFISSYNARKVSHVRVEQKRIKAALFNGAESQEEGGEK